MSNKVKFDYSRMKSYQTCPQNFKWVYIDRKVPKVPSNMYYAINGIAIQKMFEYFYNHEWYLKRDKCREFLYEKAPEIFENTLKYAYVNWNDRIAKKSKQEMYEEFLALIPKALDVIKEHKLLGTYAKSEKKIQCYPEDNKYTVLTAKVDFIIKNTKGLQILDGKHTSNKNRYIKDPTQLYFYAYLFKLKYKKYPDKIGYWFWKDSSITYIDFNDEIIEKLKEDMKEILYKIYKKKFDPTPSYGNCIFCAYKEDCDARTIQIANKRAEKQEKITKEDLSAFL